MQIGVANGIPLNDVITGDDLVPAYDQSTGTEGYVNLTTAVQKAFSGSAAGTANGVLYLNGSKVATSGSALTFDGSVLRVEAELDVKSAANLLFLNSDNTNYMYLNNPAGSGAGLGQLAFTLGGVGEQMRLTSTGLGIGTSSPSRKLTVVSETAGLPTLGNGSGGLFLSSNNGLYGLFGGINGSTGDTWLQAMRNDSVQAYNIVLNPVGGNLGLGVTPSAGTAGVKAIEIGYAGNTVYSGGLSDNSLTSNAYYNSGFKYGGVGSAAWYHQNNGDHSWHTAPSGTAGDAISFTQAMTLTAAGELLVGATAASGNSLIVNGTIRSMQQGNRNKLSIQTDNTHGAVSWAQPNLIGHYWAGTQDGVSIRVPSSVNANTGSYDILGDGTHIWYSAGGSTNAGSTAVESARIDSSGNLLVGTTTAVGRITVERGGVNWARSVNHTNAGTQYFDTFRYIGSEIGTITGNNTTTSYNTSSDYRLKNITGPVTNSGAYIDSLNPVEGTWKADGSTFVGLIAHEVQEVSRTQVATGVKDGDQMQAMDYSNPELIANLIAEVKSLRARVAALEA